MKDKTVPERGGQGVVTAGTLRVAAQAKEFVPALNRAAEKVGFSREEFKRNTPEIKKEMDSRFKEWRLEI
ncbi:hypothetical protein FRC01_008720, partial [Tulasnella sp. 417]